jgi:hypothetical protein
MRRNRTFLIALLALLIPALAWGAFKQLPGRDLNDYLGDTGKRWLNAYIHQLMVSNYAEIPEVSAPASPAANSIRLYAKDVAGSTHLFQKDSAGVEKDLALAGAGTMDDTYNNGHAITVDAGAVALTNNAANNNGVLTVEKTPVGAQSGDVVTITAGAQASGDALQFANAGSGNDVAGSGGTWSITKGGVATVTSLAGTTATIDFTDFDVSADGLITIAPDGGGAGFTINPSAALATGIDASNADIVDALNIGANNIVGTTGTINFNAFDVDAAGNVVATSLSAGSIAMDAVVAKTAATTLTVDGTGTGGVTVGGTSTGTVTLGGGSTLVNLPANVDMTITQGDFAVTDTANADMVTFTNNTMTTADILTLAAGGTRTSNNVIAITDAATTASTIGITANTQTSGNGIAYGNTGAALTGAAFRAAVTDGAGFTGYYFQAYDGAADDFSVKRYGATTIAGLASTNVLTVTAGDVQIDDGKLEIDTDEDDTTQIKRNQGVTTGPAVKIWDAAAAADNPALLITQDATAAASYGLEIDTAGSTSQHFVANGAAGIHMLMDAADAWTGQALVIDGGPWLGTVNRGMIDFRTDSAATAEVGHFIYGKFQGTGADAAGIDGKGLYLEDEAAATVGSYLVKLDTLANGALHISNAGAAADGIKIDVANSYTGQGFVADLGPWLGTTNEGFISLASDNAATVPAGQFMRFRQLGTGQHAAAIGGTLVFLEDDATAPAAGTSYAVYIDATNIEAMHVDTGKVLVDETVTATGGLSSGTASDSYIYTDTVECNNACIKGLRASKLELTPAPGAAGFVELVSAVLILDYGSEVLTVNAADNLVIEYETSGTDATAAIETDGFLTEAADTIQIVPAAAIATVASANVLNKKLMLFNVGGAEIAGNASNDTTMTVKVSYRIHAAGL